MASSIETLLYDTSKTYPHSTTRKVPMRVLCLGLSRSGTDSLKRALEELGIRKPAHGYTIGSSPGLLQKWLRLGRKKYHAKSPSEAKVTRGEFDEVLGECEAVTDFTAAVHAADLVDAYPKAKVVLNVRSDLDKWYESMNRTFTISRRDASFGFLGLFNAELYWRRQWFREVFDKFFYDDFDSTAIWRYKEHSDMVRGLVPKERLLEWSVEDGWEPLCEFLELPVPKDQEFPNGNPPKEFFERIAAFRGAQKRAAWRNVVLCIVTAGTFALKYLRMWNAI